MRWVVFGIFSLTHLATGIAYRFLSDEPFVKENPGPADAFVITRTLLKLALDTFMACEFIKALGLLVKKKSRRTKLTRYHRKAIAGPKIGLLTFIIRTVNQNLIYLLLEVSCLHYSLPT